MSFSVLLRLGGFISLQVQCSSMHTLSNTAAKLDLFDPAIHFFNSTSLPRVTICCCCSPLKSSMSFCLATVFQAGQHASLSFPRLTPLHLLVVTSAGCCDIPLGRSIRHLLNALTPELTSRSTTLQNFTMTKSEHLGPDGSSWDCGKATPSV